MSKISLFILFILSFSLSLSKPISTLAYLAYGEGKEKPESILDDLPSGDLEYAAHQAELQRRKNRPNSIFDPKGLSAR